MLPKQARKLDLRKYILSTVECGNYFAGSDTILVFKFFYDVFGEGTRLAMPKKILRAGLIVIEA